jgi:hypothetical protein
MRISTILLLTTALAAFSVPAFAQDDMGGMGGGGMGGGMGGGQMGGGGGGRHGGKGKGQGQKPAQGETAPVNAMHAPTEVPLSMRLTGVLVISGQAKALSKGQVASTKPDMSAVYAERSAQVSIDTVDLSGSGDVSMIADSRSAGLDSALLVGSQSIVTVAGGHISTTGKGANGAFVSDPGSRLSLKGVAIATHASDAFGLEASGGASLMGDGLTVTTTADRATAVAVQTPGTRAILTGCHLSTTGSASNAFFVAGALEASAVNADATDADGLMADAARAVTLTDTHLSAGGYGAMLYAGDLAMRGGSPGGAGPGGGGGPGGGPGGRGAHGGAGGPGGPGGVGQEGPSAPSLHASADAVPLTDDAPLRRTDFTMTGGALKAHRALFYVTNLHAEIVLDHVALQSDSGVLVRSAADHWGPLGRNGGDVHLVAHHQTLTGDFATDVISSITLSLADQSVLTGATTPNTDVDMDASSQWVLTGDTTVGKLTDVAIVGDNVPNITGNGHTLTYDHRHNPALANKTYALAGGGQLVPGGL